MGGVEWSKILITVMLIYRHLVIMVYSKKFSDIIVLEKNEVYSTKKLSQKFANDLQIRP